ncbi:carboxypeptidase-like regulatory domain-containing protein [Tenacibaculum sp. M341]|uniref:carboxypeptidase-like regulatory domain-containing protein n=1 Tax=Tenacibaculum sp. M341 TaxID=2530339 RepID=UPI0014055DF8|nr:carboxypeptidase-like regulatory domain-containing protein [Tenacibaculum sp. M341]
MKNISLLTIFITGLNTYGQKVIIKGNVFDGIGTIPNAHIHNKTTKQGAFTDYEGNFQLEVSLNDEIEITSIQHHTKEITINNVILQNKDIFVKLHLKDYLLDEVVIKKQNLFPSYERNFKQSIRDIAVVKSESLDFSKIDFNETVTLKDDNISKSKVDISKMVDPTKRFEGVTLTSFSLFTTKKEKRLKERIAKENFEDQLPDKIISLIGKHNLITIYKIPEDKIYLFINYAIDKKVKELVKKDKVLLLIEDIKDKSERFLKENQ